jgi:hypothetical protein
MYIFGGSPKRSPIDFPNTTSVSYEDVDYAITFKVHHNIDDPYRNIHLPPPHTKEECHDIVNMLEGISASFGFEGSTLFANASEMHVLNPSP